MTIPVVPPKLRTKRDTGPDDMGFHITANVDPGRATSSDSGRIKGLNEALAAASIKTGLIIKTHTTVSKVRGIIVVKRNERL